MVDAEYNADEVLESQEYTDENVKKPYKSQKNYS